VDARQGDCFVGCPMRTKRAFSIVPQEFDIKPRVPSWEKFTLVTTERAFP
jgi:hypothetical protein